MVDVNLEHPNPDIDDPINGVHWGIRHEPVESAFFAVAL